MSLVCVCADVGASGQVLSTARGTLDAAGGQRGVRSTWQLKTYSCSHSCSKLVALIVICKVKNHIFFGKKRCTMALQYFEVILWLQIQAR